MSKVYNSYNITLFGEPPQKNRRLTPKEQAEEKEDAAIWRRPQRTFLLDKPYLYPPRLSSQIGRSLLVSVCD